MAPACQARILVLGAALLLGACAGTPEPNAEHLSAARSLVEANPEHWRERVTAVRALGAAAGPALLAALTEEGADVGLGRRAAVGVLGLCAGEEVTAYLADELTTGRAGAIEAALALGARAGESRPELLRTVLADHSRPTELRTACACSLLELGDLERSVPYLVALWSVATPTGIDRAAAHGLPSDRVRWAHEREMARVAIARAFDGETFGLDPDSSWPAMAAATERFTKAANARMGR